MREFDAGLHISQANAPPRAAAQLSPSSIVPIAALMEMARTSLLGREVCLPCLGHYTKKYIYGNILNNALICLILRFKLKNKYILNRKRPIKIKLERK